MFNLSQLQPGIYMDFMVWIDLQTLQQNTNHVWLVGTNFWLVLFVVLSICAIQYINTCFLFYNNQQMQRNMFRSKMGRSLKIQAAEPPVKKQKLQAGASRVRLWSNGFRTKDLQIESDQIGRKTDSEASDEPGNVSIHLCYFPGGVKFVPADAMDARCRVLIFKFHSLQPMKRAPFETGKVIAYCILC